MASQLISVILIISHHACALYNLLCCQNGGIPECLSMEFLVKLCVDPYSQLLCHNTGEQSVDYVGKEL